MCTCILDCPICDKIRECIAQVKSVFSLLVNSPSMNVCLYDSSTKKQIVFRFGSNFIQSRLNKIFAVENYSAAIWNGIAITTTTKKIVETKGILSKCRFCAVAQIKKKLKCTVHATFRFVNRVPFQQLLKHKKKIESFFCLRRFFL